MGKIAEAQIAGQGPSHFKAHIPKVVAEYFQLKKGDHLVFYTEGPVNEEYLVVVRAKETRHK